MADSPAGPVVPVLFDEHAIAEDLHHLPGGARVALDAFRRELDRNDGLPMTRLKRCDAEAATARTSAAVSRPTCRGLLAASGSCSSPVAHQTRPLALRAFAFGVRHPTGNRPSVYRVAHERRLS